VTRSSASGVGSSGGGAAGDGLGPTHGNPVRSNSHHARGDSLDVMGDASTKLNRDMLEALDLAEDLDDVLLKGGQGGAGKEGGAGDDTSSAVHQLPSSLSLRASLPTKLWNDSAFNSHSGGAAGQDATQGTATAGMGQTLAGASTLSLLAAGAQELAALHQQRTGNGLLSRVSSLALTRQQSMADQGAGIPAPSPAAASSSASVTQAQPPIAASVASSGDGSAPSTAPVLGGSSAAPAVFASGGGLTAIPMPPAPLLLGQGGTWAFSPSAGGSTTSLAIDPAVEAAWAAPVPGAAGQGGTGTGAFSTARTSSGRGILGMMSLGSTTGAPAPTPQLLMMSQPSQVPSSVFSSATSTEEAVTAHFAAQQQQQQQQQQAVAGLGSVATDAGNASPLNDAFGAAPPAAAAPSKLPGGGLRYGIRDLGGMSWGLDGQQAAPGNGSTLGATGLTSRRVPPPGFGGLSSASTAGAPGTAGHSLSVLSLLHAPGSDGEAAQMLAELADWDKPGAGFGGAGMVAFGAGGPVGSVLAFGAPGTSAFGGGSTTGSGLTTPNGTISDGWGAAALLGPQGAPTLTGLAAHHSAAQLGAATERSSPVAPRPVSQPLQPLPLTPQLPEDIFSVSPSK
jgi:hypothetical protein